MSPPPEEGPGSLFDELRRGLENRADHALERVEERVWTPLTELAERLGERAAEARRCDDPLRDAGRALRLACDEIETLSMAAVLEEELRSHLEDVLPLAHALPRSMELPGADGGRRVPARGTATAVLRGDYAAGLVRRLRPEALVVPAAAALPPSPADLLGDEDRGDRLAGAAQGGREHLARVLDDLAAEATDRVRRGLLAGGPLTHLRARLRDRKSHRERDEALDALRRELADADAEARTELRRRRLSADLARRERALREAASASAGLARRLGAEAGRIRRIAEGLDALASGERPLPFDPDTDEGESGLGRLVERVQSALEERREALGFTSPTGEELEALLTRLSQRAGALAGVAEDFLEREAPGVDGPETPADGAEGPLPEMAARACRELAGELRSRLDGAREGLLEAGEIVRHGVEAARAEADGETSDRSSPGEVGEAAVRDACRRAAHRLRESADRLESEIEVTAGRLTSIPDDLLASIRQRLVSGKIPGRGAAPALPGRQGSGAKRKLRRAGRLGRLYVRASWRAVRRTASGLAARLRRWTSPPASAPEREGAQVRRPGGGAGLAAMVKAFEAGSDLAGLPANYRWLFRPDPLDDPGLVVGREDELDRLLAACRRWDDGQPSAVAVIGAPGSGRSTVLNALVARLGAEAPVRRGAVDHRLSSAEDACDWLWRFLDPRAAGEGAAGRPRPGDVEALTHALHGRRELVLIENGERLFRRSVGGYGALTVLAEFVEATADQLGWIVTFEAFPWRFLGSVSALGAAFDEVVELEPLGREALEEAVMARHRLTGYDLAFEAPESGLSGSRRARLRSVPEEERQGILRRWCFDDLFADGDRDVGEALFLWRRCLSADPGRAGIVVARTCPTPDLAPLEELDRSVLFALAALAVHGDLEREEIAAAAGSAGAGAVHLLESSRVLEPTIGSAPRTLRVRSFLHRMIMHRLREANVLPLSGGDR